MSVSVHTRSILCLDFGLLLKWQIFCLSWPRLPESVHTSILNISFFSALSNANCIWNGLSANVLLKCLFDNRQQRHTNINNILWIYIYTHILKNGSPVAFIPIGKIGTNRLVSACKSQLTLLLLTFGAWCVCMLLFCMERNRLAFGSVVQFKNDSNRLRGVSNWFVIYCLEEKCAPEQKKNEEKSFLSYWKKFNINICIFLWLSNDTLTNDNWKLKGQWQLCANVFRTLFMLLNQLISSLRQHRIITH